MTAKAAQQKECGETTITMVTKLNAIESKYRSIYSMETPDLVSVDLFFYKSKSITFNPKVNVYQ